jgi:hypothetical protein
VAHGCRCGDLSTARPPVFVGGGVWNLVGVGVVVGVAHCWALRDHTLFWPLRTALRPVGGVGRGGCGSCELDSGREHLRGGLVAPWFLVGGGGLPRFLTPPRLPCLLGVGGGGVFCSLCSFC